MVSAYASTAWHHLCIFFSPRSFMFQALFSSFSILIWFCCLCHQLSEGYQPQMWRMIARSVVAATVRRGGLRAANTNLAALRNLTRAGSQAACKSSTADAPVVQTTTTSTPVRTLVTLSSCKYVVSSFFCSFCRFAARCAFTFALSPSFSYKLTDCAFACSWFGLVDWW